MRLGIDFGTTRTVIAAARQGRYPIACFNTGEDFVEYLPGLASLSQEGVRFGTEAATAHSVEPGGPLGGLIRSVKETISGAAPDETVCQLADRKLSALQLTTQYLRYVKRMLLAQSNLDIEPNEPLEVMVAVPAQASTRQRYLTLEAFSSAGFTVLGLINEPTAAAIEFAKHSLGVLSARSPKRYVVVYDWGGGTFDTAAVSLRERRFELIGAEGISQLGGNDIDALIVDHVLTACQLERDALDARTRSHLLERCRIAKEQLSAHSRRLLVDTSGLLPTGQAEVLLDVASVYESAGPLIERTLDQVEELMSQLTAYGIDPESGRELGAIYLVGGSVHFPAVQRAVRKRFGRKVQLSPQPHATTAIGLAVAADDEAGIFVREAPTRHFGVWREQDEGREKVFDPLIERQAELEPDGSVRVSRSYYPAHPVGLLRFVECTNLDPEQQPTGEVTPWENVLFPYAPELAQKDDLSEHLGRAESVLGQEIVETYHYEPSGIIRVEIENRTSGYRRNYILERVS